MAKRKETEWYGNVLKNPKIHFDVPGAEAKSMLYQLSPFDLLSFAISVFSIWRASKPCGIYFPACRAAKVGPMLALRYE